MAGNKYRWVIFAVCFLILFAMVGVAVAPFSLYIVPVTEHFGFSPGDLSVIFTIKTVISVILQVRFELIFTWLGFMLSSISQIRMLRDDVFLKTLVADC